MIIMQLYEDLKNDTKQVVLSSLFNDSYLFESIAGSTTVGVGRFVATKLSNADTGR